MITVLVTGSNGQLGKCLQDVSQSSININWIFKSSNELDITDDVSIANVFKKNKIDYVVNCAAYTAVDKAESEPEKAFLVNAEGVRLLANACKINNAALIHISTDFVFDGKKNTPYLETDLTNPINVYGASKLKGEQYIQKILDKYYIIRTSWVYSEYGNNFVKTMLRLASERDEISVVNDQIGSPTYAGDLAQCIKRIIGLKPLEYGIYHYSNKGGISWHEFARGIFYQKGVDITLNPIYTSEYVTAAKRPKYSVLDSSKMQSQLNCESKPWEHSLKNLFYLKEFGTDGMKSQE
jgi:dTDP-4-dehydrorhamnose reductase